MANNYFRFKKFIIYQDRCAMKVGTDGVLLGAWGEVGNCVADILDIGSGTGVISLIAAQRNPCANITSIELDSASAIQCKENFDASEYKNRLTVINSSIQDYTLKSSIKFKYILSNPPYFRNSLKCDNAQKSLARHDDSLPYDLLADSVVNLLSKDGIFSAIFPYVEANVFIAVAAAKGLYCAKKAFVRGTPSRPIKRVLLQFTFDRTEIEEENFYIETEERDGFSDRYKELTSDYYL